MPEIDASTIEMVASYATRVAGVLLLLLLAWVVAGWLCRRTRRMLERGRMDPALSMFLANLVKWSILVFAVLSCLSVFGVETTSFAAVIGGASIAIGLAFQGSLSNFAAGVMLLVFRPFTIGDAINVGGQQGIVSAIDLFTTQLYTPDRLIVIPNGTVFGATIVNLTHYDKAMRVEVDVGVEYPADIDKTREVLLAAAAGVEGCRQDKEPEAVLAALGASSVDWKVRVWCDPPVYFAVHERLTEASKKALDAAGIGIPYQTIDVNIANREA